MSLGEQKIGSNLTLPISNTTPLDSGWKTSVFGSREKITIQERKLENTNHECTVTIIKESALCAWFEDKGWTEELKNKGFDWVVNLLNLNPDTSNTTIIQLDDRDWTSLQNTDLTEINQREEPTANKLQSIKTSIEELMSSKRWLNNLPSFSFTNPSTDSSSPTPTTSSTLLTPGKVTDKTTSSTTTDPATTYFRKRLPPKTSPSTTDTATTTTTAVKSVLTPTSEAEKKFVGLKEAADQGDKEALYQVGLCYEKGDGVKMSSQNAKQAWEKAAKEGHPGAQYKLGLYEEDQAKAREFYEKAAEQNHPEAEFSLASIYHNGKGVDKDLDEAFKLYKRAAEHGHKSAHFKANILERHIAEMQKTPEEKAFNEYKEAAAKGDKEATYKVGLCYDMGQGVKADLKAAREWYEQAADQGHAGAQVKMNFFYTYGKRGLPKDLEKAFTFLEKAANQGHVEGEYLLAGSYKYGLGVAKNPEKALDWYKKASEHGYLFADQQVKSLEAQLPRIKEPTKESVYTPPDSVLLEQLQKTGEQLKKQLDSLSNVMKASQQEEINNAQLKLEKIQSEISSAQSAITIRNTSNAVASSEVELLSMLDDWLISKLQLRESGTPLTFSAKEMAVINSLKDLIDETKKTFPSEKGNIEQTERNFYESFENLTKKTHVSEQECHHVVELFLEALKSTTQLYKKANLPLPENYAKLKPEINQASEEPIIAEFCEIVGEIVQEEMRPILEKSNRLQEGTLIKGELEKVQEEIFELFNQIASQEMKQEILETHKQEVSEKKAQLEDAKAHLAESQKGLEEAKELTNKTLDEQVQLQESLGKAQNNQSSAEELLKTREGTKQQAALKENSAKESLQAFQAASQKAEGKLQQAEADLAALNARIEELEKQEKLLQKADNVQEKKAQLDAAKAHLLESEKALKETAAHAGALKQEQKSLEELFQKHEAESQQAATKENSAKKELETQETESQQAAAHVATLNAKMADLEKTQFEQTQIVQEKDVLIKQAEVGIKQAEVAKKEADAQAMQQKAQEKRTAQQEAENKLAAINKRLEELTKLEKAAEQAEAAAKAEAEAAAKAIPFKTALNTRLNDLISSSSLLPNDRTKLRERIALLNENNPQDRETLNKLLIENEIKMSVEQAEVAKANNRLQQTTMETESKKTKLDKAKKELEEATSLASAALEKDNSVQNLFQTIEAREQEAKTKLESLKEKEELAQAKLKSFNEKIENLEKQEMAALKEKESREARVAEAKQQHLEKGKDVAAKRSEFEAKKKEFEAATAQSLESKQALDEATEDFNTAVAKKISDLKEKEEALESKNTEAATTLAAKEANVKALREKESKQARIVEAHNQLKKSIEDIEAKKRELEVATAQSQESKQVLSEATANVTKAREKKTSAEELFEALKTPKEKAVTEEAIRKEAIEIIKKQESVLAEVFQADTEFLESDKFKILETIKPQQEILEELSSTLTEKQENLQSMEDAGLTFGKAWKKSFSDDTEKLLTNVSSLKKEYDTGWIRSNKQPLAKLSPSQISGYQAKVAETRELLETNYKTHLDDINRAYTAWSNFNIAKESLETLKEERNKIREATSEQSKIDQLDDDINEIDRVLAHANNLYQEAIKGSLPIYNQEGAAYKKSDGRLGTLMLATESLNALSKNLEKI